MLKSRTVMKRVKSHRNRHNGKINAAKQQVLDKGESFIDSNGKSYTALISKKRIIGDLYNDDYWLMSSSIVRGALQ